MVNELYINMGARVREKREELRLSRDKMAECIDVSPQFLAQIELGRRGMSSATLYKICDTLGVSADYILMGRSGEGQSSAILSMIDNLNPKKLSYLEDIIKAFVLAVNK